MKSDRRHSGVCEWRRAGWRWGEPVKRRLVWGARRSRSYLRQAHFAEDESAKRLERSELVLKKFRSAAAGSLTLRAVSAESVDGADRGLLRRQDQDGKHC